MNLKNNQDEVEIEEKILLTSSSNKNATNLWDLNKKTLIKKISTHLKGVTCLIAYEDESLSSSSSSSKKRTTKIIVGHKDDAIRVFDWLNETCLTTLRGHERKVYCLKLLTFENDFGHGKLLASGSEDMSIKCWWLGTEQNWVIINIYLKIGQII